MSKTAFKWTVMDDLNWGLYHVTVFPRPNSADEDERAKAELVNILNSHAKLADKVIDSANSSPHRIGGDYGNK